MPAENPSENQIAEVNERLNAGIETCRSVVANYKSLLSSDSTAEEEAETAEIPATR